MRPIVLTRRITIAIITITACSSIVGATLLSNYLVPSTANITSQPGITVLSTDTTGACTAAPVTTFAIGDVQQGQSKAFATICVKNSQGSTTQFVLQQPTVTSLTTTTALPSGVSLSWNFPTSSVGVACGSQTTGCIALAPGQTSQSLTLSLNASTSATPGAISFTIQFNAFSTATG